jgi:hypothetical protein
VTPNLPSGAPPLPDQAYPPGSTPPTNSGYWFGGTGLNYVGGRFFQHSSTYVPGSNGKDDPSTRDWCENVQGNTNFPALVDNPANDMSWMSLHCDMPEVQNDGKDYLPAERWAATKAQNALYQAWLCWIDYGENNDVHPNLHDDSWSNQVYNYFHSGDTNECEVFDSGCEPVILQGM